MDNAEKVLAGTQTSKRHYVLVVVSAFVFGGLFYMGFKPWQARQNRLFASSEKPGDKIVVSTVRAALGATTSELIFTGALFASTETTVYARSEGYIKLRTVDLGDRVKAGQLLAEIDTPELDEQLRQSRYRYDQFKAQSGATQAAARLAQLFVQFWGVDFRQQLPGLDPIP